METYIAESYQDRSIIEIIQNADDAASKRFYIKQVNNSIIVANDGRAFSNDDVKSICRSGASTKERGTNTIGYRGIGFKSVVNLAQRVHIVSKSVKITFSRELTNFLLKSEVKVPLIRIPHNYSPINDLENTINKLFEEDYNTIFIFEDVKLENVFRELELFDSSSLLFLRNIKQVEFDANISKYISVMRIKKDKRIDLLTIKDEGEKEEWLVVRGEEEKSFEAIALLLNEDKTIKPLDIDKAVVHSFMPTEDKVGLPFKINGDFSTDPSRTKVTMDQTTEKVSKKCVEILFWMLNQSLANQGTVRFEGIFEVLSKFNNDIYSVFKKEKSYKNYFIELLKDTAKNNSWFIQDGINQVSLNQLLTNPKWLNLNDFKLIVQKTGKFPLSLEQESKSPGIISFFEEMGVETLTIKDALNIVSDFPPSDKGAVELIIEIINQYRYKFSQEIRDSALKARIYKINGELNSLIGTNNQELLDSDFMNLLIKRSSNKADLKWFFQQLGINPETFLLVLDSNDEKSDVSGQLGSNRLILKEQENHHVFESNKSLTNVSTSMRFNKGITKWRTVETNLKEFLGENDNVVKVTDVSKSNLGYDLEVETLQGEIFIEVKSVDNMGSTFSMTNNEYSTANEYGNKYTLAIVKQNNKGMEVCFIKDPINSLSLTKRVTRWEWICDEYDGEIVLYDF